MESPTETDGGVFHSPRVTFSNGAADGEPSGTIASATATDVTVLDPAKIKSDAFAASVLYSTAEVEDVHITRDTEPRELSVRHATVQLGAPTGNGVQDITGTVEGLAVSPSLFARGRFKPEKLGYDKLVFDISGEGSLDRASGIMTIRDFTVSLRNGGTLSISGTVGDLPDPRVLNDSDVASKVSQVQLHDLIIRYEDNSFLGRLLDLLAGEQQLSRSEYVQQLSAALPFLLAVLTHPEFRQELIDALTKFLQDPKSFTVKIEPDPPISAHDVRSLARTALGTIPDRLKASVSADTPQ